ncbi:MAG: hypothetical protein QXT14_02755 [Candidatus Bathyarchaeia archaeon]
MSVCEELAKIAEELCKKVYEAYLSKSVEPREIKTELESFLEAVKRVSEKASCKLDLSGLKGLIEEADEDSNELEEAKKSLGR